MNATKETAREVRSLLLGITKALPGRERNIAFANVKLIEKFINVAEEKLPHEKKPKEKKANG